MKKIRLVSIYVLSFMMMTVQTWAVPAPVSVRSYADTNAASNEVRIPFLTDDRKVITTAKTAMNTLSFATKIEFPAPVDGFTFTSASFSLQTRIAGVVTNPLTNISMAASRYNIDDISDTSRPNIYARMSNGVLIVVPVNSQMVGTVLNGVSALYITDQPVTLGGSFPRMSSVGDYYRLTRSLAFTWTGGSFSVTNQPATVELVDILVNFPNPTTITPSKEIAIEVSKVAGGYALTAGGLTESWPYTHRFEKTYDLESWSALRLTDFLTIVRNSDNTYTVTVAVPAMQDRCFWRILNSPTPPAVIST